MKIQLKRSSILENGVAKEPTAGQMEYGELAVNYNENDISIFTKDSDNNIRRVGGSINKGSGEPGDPGTTPGDWYFDITNGILFYWNGTEWEEVQSVNKLIAGNGIEITTATTGSTFTVDLAGGDDGLEFDGGKLKATLASESDYGVVKIGDGVVADNGVIKAKNTISVGENPPAINLKQGDLWWNSNEDNGRLYVYYEDENTQQWIDASPQGGNLEQDQADTLYLSKKNDDTAAGNITFDKNIYVKQSAGIGGTAADPNISLNASGAMSGRSLSVNENSAISAISSTNRSNSNKETFKVTGSGGVYIGSDIVGSGANITLNADGSGTFAGDVTITDGTNSRHEIKVLDINGATGALHDFRSASGFPGANSAIRVILGNDQNIKLAYDGSATFAGDIGIGGTLPSAPNISLNASGSAEFASYILSGPNTGVASSDATGVTVHGKTGAGQVLIYKSSSDTTAQTRPFFGCYTPGASPKTLVEFASDGSAEFAGIVTSDRPVSGTPANTWACFNGGNNGTITSSIRADGSATFAGDIQAGGNPSDAASTGTRIYSGGLCQVSAPNTTSPVFRAYQTGSSTITSLIRADGSATFAKDVEVNGVTVGRGGGGINTNTANGVQALFSNTTGNDNTANGFNALRENTEGGNNTAIGRDALLNNTTGSSNTAIGETAGRFTQAAGNATAFNNCTYLGYNSRASGSNQVQLGNSATTTYAYGAVQDRSDERDKTDVRDTLLGLDFIKSLRPVDFRWDMRDDYFNKETYEVEETCTRQVANAAYTVDGEEPEYIEEEYTETVIKERLVPTTKDGSRSRKRFHHGLIAQEVKAAADAQGVDFAGYQDHSIDGGLDVLSLGYTELLAPLIKAVQELSAENADLKARLDAAGI